MSNQPAGGNDSTEENHIETYMKILDECRTVAVSAYARHREMFQQGLQTMCSIDPILANEALSVKVRALRDRLHFLKSLVDTPLFGPGVHQMDGDPSEIPSGHITLHAPVVVAAAAAAAPGQASGSHIVKPPHGAGRGLPSKRAVQRR